MVDYLIEHGISPNRLTAVGYGKLRPKVVSKRLAASYKFLQEGDTLTEQYIKKLKENQQDTCNALNRRTEFRVLKTTYGLFDDSGKIDAKALLDNKAPKKTGKTEPVVKVYIPTPAEAAAADGKKLPEKKTESKAKECGKYQEKCSCRRTEIRHENSQPRCSSKERYRKSRQV